MLRGREEWLTEHDVCSRYTEERTEDLNSDICGGFSPAHPPLERERERDDRIKVSSGDRPENENDGDEHRTRRQCVCQERNCSISSAEPLSHDSGADDGRQKEHRSSCLCRELSGRIHKRSFMSS